jgi:aspartate aminotransferase-like enzyme
MKGEELIMLPGPVGVSHEVLLAMATPTFNHRGPRFFRLYSDVKEKLRKILNTSAEIYFITGSGTAGNEFAVSNLVSPGEKVVVCTNGFFADRLRDAFRVYGADVVEVVSKWGKSVDLDELKKRVDGASIVAAVFNETSTGVVNQVKEISRVAHSAGALCLVDNISGIGNEYYMDPWGIDVTVVASQKGLATPPGVSFVAVSPAAKEKASKTPKRSLYFNMDLFDKSSAEFSTPATPSVNIVYAFNKALDLILEEGLERFVKRHYTNAEAFRRGISALGLELLADPKFASNTLSALVLKEKAKDVVKTMLEKYEVVVSTGLGAYKENLIRVGHMGRVDAKDIVTTLSALELSLRHNGLLKTKLGEGVAAAMEYYYGS